MIEMASAAPSVGSVPAPNSSNRTRLFGFKLEIILTIFFMCEENVDKDCSMLCSSPMSAYISVNTETSLPVNAGIAKPLIAISENNPNVLRETVLPPVLGPVITSVSKSLPIEMSMGTAFSGAKRGWRAFFKLIIPLLLISGISAFMESEYFARAKIKSRFFKSE